MKLKKNQIQKNIFKFAQIVESNHKHLSELKKNRNKLTEAQENTNS